MGHDPGQCPAGTGIELPQLLCPSRHRISAWSRSSAFTATAATQRATPARAQTGWRLSRPRPTGLFGYAHQRPHAAPCTDHRQLLRPAVIHPFPHRLLRDSRRRGIAVFPVGADSRGPAHVLCRPRPGGGGGGRVGGDQSTVIRPRAVALMHSEDRRKQAYEAHFGCPVSFAAPCSEIQVDAAAWTHPCPCGTRKLPPFASNSASCCWRA